MIILPNMKSSIYKIRTLPFKILVGGDFTSYDGTPQYRIARLNFDGSRDTSFSTGDGFAGKVNAITVQSNGKIFAGGSFTSYNGTTANRITKLNSDGTLDDIFGGTSLANNEVRAVAIQPASVDSVPFNDSIIIGGDFTSYNGTAQNRITRLKSNDGTLSDTLLSIGTGFNNTVRAIAIQSDRKIIIGGNFISYNGTAQNRITRLNSDGTRDIDFTIGTGFNNVTYSIAIQSDGKIIIGGVFTSYRGTTQNRITRLNSDGTRDTSFTIGTGFSSGIVNAIAIQADGKIIAGGSFTNYDGTTQNRITRLNSDGTRDTSFTIGTGIAGTVNTIAIQSDGKIIIGGNFTFYNGAAQNYIVRLNSDGTRDTSFVIGTGFNLEIYAIVIT